MTMRPRMSSSRLGSGASCRPRWKNTTSSDLAEYLKLVPDAPSQRRRELRLRFCEGLSFREIAKALHLSVGKAYALVVAGLEALVQKLRRTQHDEGERP